MNKPPMIDSCPLRAHNERVFDHFVSERQHAERALGAAAESFPVGPVPTGFMIDTIETKNRSGARPPLSASNRTI